RVVDLAAGVRVRLGCVSGCFGARSIELLLCGGNFGGGFLAGLGDVFRRILLRFGNIAIRFRGRLLLIARGERQSKDSASDKCLTDFHRTLPRPRNAARGAALAAPCLSQMNASSHESGAFLYAR